MKIPPKICFSISGFDWSLAREIGEFELDGRTCYVRHFFDNVLLRFDYPEDISRTLFLTRKLPLSQRIVLSSDETFVSQIRAREMGRFVIYRSPSAMNCCIALFFRPDGTGFFQDKKGYGNADEDDTVSFVWNAGMAGMTFLSDVLDALEKNLQPLCERVYVEQVWPAMRDPHASIADFPDQPLQFVRGSKSELVRLTLALCRISNTLYLRGKEPYEPNLLISYNSVAVENVDEAAATLKNPFSDAQQYKETVKTLIERRIRSARLQRLQALILAHNLFVGGEWRHSFSGRGKRITRYWFDRETIHVPVPSPPSAHERIEAFLELSEWLEDKITPEEKAQLLGTEADRALPR